MEKPHNCLACNFEDCTWAGIEREMNIWMNCPLDDLDVSLDSDDEEREYEDADDRFLQ